eukprot:scaffold1784_cov116-Cylindrotheca_fusiformis.AAC.11
MLEQADRRRYPFFVLLNRSRMGSKVSCGSSLQCHNATHVWITWNFSLFVPSSSSEFLSTLMKSHKKRVGILRPAEKASELARYNHLR